MQLDLGYLCARVQSRATTIRSSDGSHCPRSAPRHTPAPTNAGTITANSRTSKRLRNQPLGSASRSALGFFDPAPSVADFAVSEARRHTVSGRRFARVPTRTRLTASSEHRGDVHEVSGEIGAVCCSSSVDMRAPWSCSGGIADFRETPRIARTLHGARTTRDADPPIVGGASGDGALVSPHGRKELYSDRGRSNGPGFGPRRRSKTNCRMFRISISSALSL